MTKTAQPGTVRWAYGIAIGLAILVFGIAAWLTVRWRVNLVDRAWREELLLQARSIAQTIDVDLVHALSFTADDVSRPEFQRLSDHLSNYYTVLHCRGIYTLARRDNKLIFGPESYAPDDPQASPPGTVYQKPSEQDQAIFDNGLAFTIGPVRDEYGSFISAMAPVIDPRNGQVLLAVGIDVEADTWEATLAREHRTAILSLLPLPLILCLGIGAIWWRNRLPPERRSGLRHVEMLIVGLFGLTLTLIAHRTLRDIQARARRHTFLHLAEMQTALVLDAFDDLRDYQLKALAAFFAGSDFVTREEFHTFIATAQQRFDLRALAWVEPVSEAARAALEVQVRAEGISDFTIWQQGADGREPAHGRAVYYPILYIEPSSWGQTAWGCDLGADPAIRATLEKAIAVGLPAATTSFALRSEENIADILIFWPVFSNTSHTLQGMLMAAFYPEAFLHSALFVQPGEKASAIAEIYRIQSGQPPYHLASSWNSTGSPPPASDKIASEIIRPILIFDQTYVLKIRPGPEFIAANPLWAERATLLGGVIITALLVTIAELETRYRTTLETQVQARTAELRATLYSIGDAVITTDLEGRIQQMNPVAEHLTGWTEQKARGQPLEMVFQIVNETTHAPAPNLVQRVLREGLVVGLANHTLLIARNGIEYPIADSGAPIRDPEGNILGVVLVFRDQTDERAAQRALQESEARFRTLFEQAGVGIALMDIGDGSLIACNPALVRFLGYSEDELRTLTFKDTTHPDDLAEDERLWEQLCAGQCDLYTLEKRYYRKDDQLVWGHLTASLIRDATGKPWIAVVMVEDITGRKQAEAKLAEQLDELRRWYQATLGRETRVLELKREVNELLRRLGEPIRYPSAEDQDSKGLGDL